VARGNACKSSSEAIERVRRVEAPASANPERMRRALHPGLSGQAPPAIACAARRGRALVFIRSEI